MKNRFRMGHWRIAAAAAVAMVLGTGAVRPTGAMAATDHYLCYAGALAKGEFKLVAPFPFRDLKDQVEDLKYDAKKPMWHCNPASKIHRGVTYDISHPTIHLEGYQIALSKPPTVPAKQTELKPRSAIVRDQFGELPLIVKVPESVEVRTSKTPLAAGTQVKCTSDAQCTVAPATHCLVSAGVCVADTGFPVPPVFPNPDVDNYKCYKVGLQPGFKFTKIVGAVKAQDQFGGVCSAGDPAKLPPTGLLQCQVNADCDGPTPTVGNGVCGPITYDIIAPTRLCMPVNKAGEDPGAELHTDHLMCYSIAPTKTVNKPKFPKFLVADSNGNFPNNRLNVTAAAKELCVPASKKIYYCGDGILDQPYEDCDAPKVCDAGSPLPGIPCTGNSGCTPGKCIPNVVCPDATGLPNKVACSKTCQCAIPTANLCYGYHVSDFAMKIEAAVPSLSADPLVFDLDSSTGSGNTTLQMCVGSADTGGRRPVTMDKSTWIFDSIPIPPSGSLPFPLTVRLCPNTNASGTIFTKSSAAVFPGKVCVAGDPAKLETACAADANCDGPVPTAGNGVCATLDVDYTSSTSAAGTAYVQGDGKKDKPGSALMGVELRADLYIGNSTCVGTGVLTGDPTTDCYACDDVNPQPVGRIGNVSGFTGPATISIPLALRLSSGNEENKVNAPGNPLDQSEITGHGYLVTGRSLRLGAANGKLNIFVPPPIGGFVHAQFFASESFSPGP